MLRHFINCLLYILPPTRFFTFRQRLLKLAGINISKNVSFSGHGWIYGRGELSIGEETWLSPGVKIYTHQEAVISIGTLCDIGPDVSFITGTHEIGLADRRAGTGLAKSISIGNGTWIGANSTILAGVHIGSGCVVAAGSVVANSIPDNTLVAGVPAKVKRGLK